MYKIKYYKLYLTRDKMGASTDTWYGPLYDTMLRDRK